MAIDFHAPENRFTYATRPAQADWAQAIREILDPRGKRVADIGCGGGIYSAAWAGLGAAEVIAVDFSAEMVRAAAEKTRGLAGGSVRQGDAQATGLPDACVDVVFQRALLHHLKDLAPCFAEARRLLAPGGIFLAQNRTPEDVALAGSPEHVRGYFFEALPRLRNVESKRRPTLETVERGLRAAGFIEVEARTVWETRQVHADKHALAADLRARTGRSILHELSDAELDRLCAYLLDRLPDREAVPERDRWTIWVARAGN